MNPCTFKPSGEACKTRKFIDNYGIGIANLIKNTGIFFPTIVGMVCLESGYGQSKITTDGFNFGGIKYNPNKHTDFILADTSEYVNGRKVAVKAKFAKFKSVEDGLKGQFNTMMADRYKKARCVSQTSDENLTLKQIELFASSGYTTTPAKKYVSKLKGIVNACIDYKQIGRIGDFKNNCK